MHNRQHFADMIAMVAGLVSIAISSLITVPSAAIAADNATGLTVSAKKVQSPGKPLAVTKRTLAASYPGCEGSFTYPEFSNPGNEGCSALNAAVKHIVKAKLSELKEHSDSFADSNSRAVVDGTYEIRYLGENFVSVAFYFHNYFGTGHGITENVSFNYDLNSQCELSLDSFFGGNVDYGLVSDLCRIQLFQGLQGGEESMVMEGTEANLDNFACWFPGSKGITIKFCQYQVAPYSAGMPEVFLPYDQLRSCIHKSAPMEKILPIPAEATIASRLSDANYRKHQLEVEMECFVARKPEFMSIDAE